ncbi:hypothetical protein QN277_023627 [Acacia crassicarpa]|uniref:Sieve element occlusion N-terminal domain-containing protein n=1 Tax=Acacia crassicarpa TaxID=499986 RepID=A0AAE1JCZ5_9FABA|nr:hypothetical protein QN277_023627 [Acacia crassicarpa]
MAVVVQRMMPKLAGIEAQFLVVLRRTIASSHPRQLAAIHPPVRCSKEDKLSYKFLGGGDAHATAMGFLNMLSSYSWHAKVVLTFRGHSSNANAIIHVAAYWSIQSIVACASHIASLIGLRNEYVRKSS